MRQLTILAVDDDPDDLENFKETLLEVGHNVNLIIAYDGHEALDQLSKLHPKPDIIFLDFNMPMMDGKHCLMKLKNDSSLMHIPVVMHSTTFSDEDIAFYHAHDARP